MVVLKKLKEKSKSFSSKFKGNNKAKESENENQLQPEKGAIPIIREMIEILTCVYLCQRVFGV